MRSHNQGFKDWGKYVMGFDEFRGSKQSQRCDGGRVMMPSTSQMSMKDSEEKERRKVEGRSSLRSKLKRKLMLTWMLTWSLVEGNLGTKK